MKYKSERAFTLVEIISVIVIIGIVALIAVPSIAKYVADSKKTAYFSYENSMEAAAKNLVIKCIEGKELECDLPKENEKNSMYLNELVNKGYVELMKNPEGEGFCDGDLSYVEIANTGKDYEYSACLYCGQYKTDKSLCTTYTYDNDDPVCGEKMGEATNGRWINTNRSISIKCSDATTGCTRSSYSKTFTTTTKDSTISIADKSGRKVYCPVLVYVDKTMPTCDLKVTGEYDSDLGWYTGEVTVELENWQDTDSGVLTYGIGTSIIDRDYNKNTSVTVKSGITTVIGYVKDQAGNEGICAKTIRVGATKPKFDFRYAYTIFPSGEEFDVSGISVNGSRLTTTNTTPTLTIHGLNKYTSVDRVVITLNSPIINSTIGRLDYTGVSGTSSSAVTAPMTSGTSKIIFNVPSGNYSDMKFTLGGISGATYTVEKIELYTINGGVFTNKDVTIKIDPIDTGVRTVGYSYDGGLTFQTRDENAFVRNTEGQLLTKNAGNILSEPTNFVINGIDKEIPTCTLKAEGVKYTGTNRFLSDVAISFATVADTGISGIDNYGLGSYKGSRTATHSANTTQTYTGYIRDKAGSEKTCTVTVEKNSAMTLTYNNNGGSGCTSKTINYNSQYGTLCTPTRAGYTFAGWYTQASGGTQITATATVTVTQNQTVYAHWSVNNYTIKFNGNGNTGGSTADKVCTYDANCVLTSNGYSKTGHTFAGWATSSGGSVVYANGATVKNLATSGTYTLYARWTANTYTLTYNNNGGSGCSTKTGTYGSSWGSLCTPSRTGYTFNGWSPNYTNQTITGNVSTTASWKVNTYTLTYNNNGGSGCTSKSGTYGSSWGSLCTPSRTGYTFTGWSPNYTNQTITGNVSTTATWRANTYTLTYNNNGGSGCSSKTGTYGGSWGSLCTPTRDKYNFTGWSPNYTNKTVTGNVSTTATWEQACVLGGGGERCGSGWVGHECGTNAHWVSDGYKCVTNKPSCCSTGCAKCSNGKYKVYKFKCVCD
ncbi:MAG: InlB B-repeat-containing protein [Bacilli bacterium]|nr:InlB B-repeat-containing protein [Bacilli bacterium]